MKIKEGFYISIADRKLCTLTMEDPMSQSNPLLDLYTSSEFSFKRPFPFNKAVAVTVKTEIAKSENGNMYVKATFTDSQNSEVVLAYMLAENNVKYNRDFFSKVIQSQAPAGMEEHTLSTEQMLLFIPRLFELVESTSFETIVVAQYNRAKDNRRALIFESIESAEEYLANKKSRSKGVPVPKKESEKSERTQQSNEVLQSLGL